MKFLSYPISILFFLCFGLALLIFHPIQWFCYNVLGYKAHKIVVVWLQFWLMRSTNVLGTRYSFKNNHKIDRNRPTIIVANHQSMYDIPPILWYFRNQHPKFISKRKLGKGIPSVSYNLRYGGSVLIDRRKPLQSIKAIEEFAKQVEKNNWAAVIFPEGTRSRDGKPKAFKTKGLNTLLEYMPTAQIVPLTINNSWKMLRFGQFPMGLGAHIKYTVHIPLDNNPDNVEKLIQTIEKQITEAISYE